MNPKYKVGDLVGHRYTEYGEHVDFGFIVNVGRNAPHYTVRWFNIRNYDERHREAILRRAKPSFVGPVVCDDDP